MMEEVWKDIEGYEGIYQVSSHGRVRSVDRLVHRTNPRNGKPLSFVLKGCIIKQRIGFGNYYFVRLKVIEPFKGHYVHRLVAKAFVPGYFEGAIVNHKDENKTNNHADNLEWCTYKYNMNYGTWKKRSAEKKYKPVEQLAEDGSVMHVYESVTEAAKAVGTSTTHIASAIRDKRRHKAGGFRWRYADR